MDPSFLHVPFGSIVKFYFHAQLRMNRLFRNYHLVKVNVVIYKAFCLDMAQGHMNGAPKKTQTDSCRFASLAC